MFRKLVVQALSKVVPRMVWRWRAQKWLVGVDSEPEVQLLPLLCRPNAIAIDIGAALGLYTIHMIGYSKACYAFEARPDQARQLRELFDGSRPPVTVENVAVSDRAGTTSLRIVLNDLGRSTIEAANDLDGFNQVQRIDVPTRTLDEYALKPVAFIKIDVEGHELSVLQGAQQTIRDNHPALLMEVEDRHRPRARASVIEFLTPFGYAPYIVRNNVVQKLGSGDTQHNLLFLTAEQAARLVNKALPS